MKRLIILISFLILISLSCVSAADDVNETLTASDDANDIIELPETDETLADPLGSFSELQSRINQAREGSIVTLDKNYAYNSGFTDLGIVITKSITINGNGHTLDAGGHSIIFFIDVNSDKTYTFNDITFVAGYTNGYAGGYHLPGGGAICSAAGESVINVNNCNFLNNYASDQGGAIYGEVINLNNCNFQNNRASYEGGAVFMEGGTVSNCVFENNHALGTEEFMGSGGAIFSQNYRKCTITESRFIANSAQYHGGALTVLYNDDGYGYYSQVLISNNHFERNSATMTGGAIYMSGSMDSQLKNEIRGCNFVENTVSEGSGGAIRADSLVDIDHCDFTNNNADGATAICEAKSITNCNFASNKNDYFVYAESSVTLSNNKMTADNKYDILISEGESPSRVKSNLVFANTLAVPNSIVEICKFQDDNGNVIRFESGITIHVKFTNRDTKTTKETTIIRYYMDGEPYYYQCDLAEGTYDVTGSADISNYNVKPGVLIVDANTDFTLSAGNLTKYYHGPERFGVTVTNGNNRLIPGISVDITVNGQTYTRTTDSNGVASIAINLNSGTYPVTCECGDAKTRASITVLKTILGNDITKIFRNGTQYYATFIDTQGKALKNTEVEFNINGVFYKRPTNDNGVARLNINLNPGEYVITAINPSNGEQYTNKITVLTNYAEHNDLTKYYKNASQYKVRILADDASYAKAGVKVTFNINGVFYERYSDDEGYVKMNINLEPGEYIITADYNGLRASNKITVKSVIKSDDLVMSYRDGSRFNATILDGQGNPYPNQTVTFNINGVFYEKITDENGVAGLAINLMAGEYIITSSYNGMNAANKVTVSG